MPGLPDNVLSASDWTTATVYQLAYRIHYFQITSVIWKVILNGSQREPLKAFNPHGLVPHKNVFLWISQRNKINKVAAHRRRALCRASVSRRDCVYFQNLLKCDDICKALSAWRRERAKGMEGTLSNIHSADRKHAVDASVQSEPGKLQRAWCTAWRSLASPHTANIWSVWGDIIHRQEIHDLIVSIFRIDDCQLSHEGNITYTLFGVDSEKRYISMALFVVSHNSRTPTQQQLLISSHGSSSAAFP